MGTLKTYTIDLILFLWGVVTKKDVVKQFDSQKKRNIALGKVLGVLLFAVLLIIGAVLGWSNAWGPFAGDENFTFVLMLVSIALSAWGFLGYATKVFYEDPNATYEEVTGNQQEEFNAEPASPVNVAPLPLAIPVVITEGPPAQHKAAALAQAYNNNPNAQTLQQYLIIGAAVVTIVLAVSILVKTAIELIPVVLAVFGIIYVWMHFTNKYVRFSLSAGLLLVAVATTIAIAGIKEGNYVGKWIAKQFETTQAEDTQEPVQAPALPTPQPIEAIDPTETAEEQGKNEIAQMLYTCVVLPIQTMHDAQEEAVNTDNYIAFDIILHGGTSVYTGDELSGMEYTLEFCQTWLNTSTIDASGNLVEGGFLERMAATANPGEGYTAPLDPFTATQLTYMATLAVSDILNNLIDTVRELESVDGENPNFTRADNFARDAIGGIRELNDLLAAQSMGDVLYKTFQEDSIPVLDPGFVQDFEEAFERLEESRTPPTPLPTLVPTAVPFVPQAPVVYPTAVPQPTAAPALPTPVRQDGVDLPTW